MKQISSLITSMVIVYVAIQLFSWAVALVVVPFLAIFTWFSIKNSPESRKFHQEQKAKEYRNTTWTKEDDINNAKLYRDYLRHKHAPQTLEDKEKYDGNFRWKLSMLQEGRNILNNLTEDQMTHFRKCGMNITDEKEEILKRCNEVASQVKKCDEFRDTINDIPRFEVVLSKSVPARDYHDVPKIQKRDMVKKSAELVLNYVVVSISKIKTSSYTTGIMQLSAIKYEDAKPIECFNSLINPDIEVTQEMADSISVSVEDLVKAPKISEVIQSFDKFCSDCDIAGFDVASDFNILWTNGSNIHKTRRDYFDVKSIFMKYSDNNYYYETIYSFGEGYRIVFNVNDGALVNCKAINELIKKDVYGE